MAGEFGRGGGEGGRGGEGLELARDLVGAEAKAVGGAAVEGWLGFGGGGVNDKLIMARPPATAVHTTSSFRRDAESIVPRRAKGRLLQQLVVKSRRAYM